MGDTVRDHVIIPHVWNISRSRMIFKNNIHITDPKYCVQPFSIDDHSRRQDPHDVYLNIEKS